MNTLMIRMWVLLLKGIRRIFDIYLPDRKSMQYIVVSPTSLSSAWNDSSNWKWVKYEINNKTVVTKLCAFQRLCLRQNLIIDIEGLEPLGDCLKELDLYDNKISRIRGLSNLRALT